MPRSASTVANGIDQVFYWILAASVFFFVGIIAAMVWFAWQYRQQDPNQKTHPISGNATLEWVWTLLPTVGLFVLFGFGFVRWLDLTVPPGDAMEIRANAKRWQWNFDYPRHKISGTPELIVPADRNIKLTMISSDVLHSFYVPEFRVKRDVLPNRYTVVWFKVPKKALTRLNSVKRADLQLKNVVHKMAFAKNVSIATKLIQGGHIQINGKVINDPDSKVKLNDRISVNISPAFKTKLLTLNREYGNKIKEALGKKDNAKAAKLRKEQNKAFVKALGSNDWLLGVLNEMKKATDTKAAIASLSQGINGAYSVMSKPAEAQKFFERTKMTPADYIKQNKPALAAAQKLWDKNYKLPEWLYADRDGLDGMWGFVSDTFNIFCTEYCGKEHSRMITRVRVVSGDLFNFWLQRSLNKSPSGKQLLERYGCVSCHSLDGSANTGPTFYKLYGRKEQVTDQKDGSVKTLTLVDKSDKDKAFSEYVRESIYKPQAKIVKGFEGKVMPTFQGQMPISHVNIIIDYLKYMGSEKK